MIQFWTAVLREDTMRRSVGDTGTEYSHYALKWRRRNCDSQEYSLLVLATGRYYYIKAAALKFIALKLLLYKCLIHMMMSHVPVNNLQSSFRINLALDYQPRRDLTASSVDFHWAGNFVRESNQSAVDETHLSLHAESRDAFSDRPYAEKLDHRARKRMACNQCVFSNA
ncbi:hypothetical protein ALC53_08847 [Atta colombica]|uniref:Uncharacterized protein n=1 Tax=Atta colombica TaxID=520822 RepID=A0A195B819_9HYME|nr:hypothetical protein ALC53_08847 [Atta colombica]